MKNRKKRWILISLAILVVVLTAISLSGCLFVSEKFYDNIAAQSNPYSMGTQSILIEASYGNADVPIVKFKRGISTADIVLGGALEGKTVKNVTYNSDTSITVVLEGNTKVAGGDDVYGSITVKHSGLDSEGSSSCVVNVRPPEIKISAFTVSKKTVGDVTTHRITAELSLPVGTFTAKAPECVTLSDGTTGEMSVELSGDFLKVTITDCNTANPSICLRAEATTIEKNVTVKLSMGGKANFQEK